MNRYLKPKSQGSLFLLRKLVLWF